MGLIVSPIMGPFRGMLELHSLLLYTDVERLVLYLELKIILLLTQSQ